MSQVHAIVMYKRASGPGNGAMRLQAGATCAPQAVTQIWAELALGTGLITKDVSGPLEHMHCLTALTSISGKPLSPGESTLQLVEAAPTQ